MGSLKHEARRLAAYLQTKFSPKVSYLDLANHILDAGWTGEDAVTAFAVVGGESGFKTHGMNITKDGRADYGLFQINDIHKPTEEQKWVPSENAKKAHSIWMQRKNWGKDGFDAWMAYKNRNRSEDSKASWSHFMNLGREWIGKAQATR